MNKAILVIDMPEDCVECNFCVELSAHDRCVAAGKSIFTIKKPDWCPLKELPEKMEGYNSIKWQWGEYEDGWNHCIDCLIDE